LITNPTEFCGNSKKERPAMRLFPLSLAIIALSYIALYAQSPPYEEQRLWSFEEGDAQGCDLCDC